MTVAASVSVHLLPSLLAGAPSRLTDAAAVVIDLLRASTTITHALEAGAARVLPVLEVDDALRLREKSGAEEVILGGERHGVRIPGFDLGNSPGEYTATRVAGKTVIFTTTNGTRALHACHGARRVLVGCFANLTALEHAIASETRVHLVCAGTDAEPALEDSLFAGAVVARLTARGFIVGNDQARLVLDAWDTARHAPGGIIEALHASRGGRNLASIGLSRDVEECARVDTCSVVPELDPSRSSLVVHQRP